MCMFNEPFQSYPTKTLSLKNKIQTQGIFKHINSTGDFMKKVLLATWALRDR